MRAATDARLHAEADRRSVPAVEPPSLRDVITAGAHVLGMTPEQVEELSGLVLDGEVYDVARVRTEWAACIREPHHAEGHRPGALMANRPAAVASGERMRDIHLACGRVLSRDVADTGWRAA